MGFSRAVRLHQLPEVYALNPTLKSRLRVAFLAVLVTGASVLVYVREPPGRGIAELRDAGLISERTDRWVLECTEAITPASARYLKRNGYGTFRVGSVHRIARVIVEHGDAGEVVNASLDTFGSDADGGNEENETDDAVPSQTGCTRQECNALPDVLRFLDDGGFRHQREDGGEAPWCGSTVRRGRVPPRCAMPDCFTGPDASWDDNAVVDCKFGPPYAAVPTWRGCNVGLGSSASGTQCLPVECSLPPGSPIDVLR